MRDSLASEKALGTDGRGALSREDFVVAEKFAMAGPELREGCPLNSREVLLRRGNWRRFGAEDRVGSQICDRRANSRGMDGLKYGSIVTLIYKTVREMWLKERLIFRLKSCFH